MSSLMGDVPDAGPFEEDEEMDSHDQIPPFLSSSFETPTPAGLLLEPDESTDDDDDDSQIQFSQQGDNINGSETKDKPDAGLGCESDEEENTSCKESQNNHHAFTKTTKCIDQNNNDLNKRARYRTDYKERGCFVIFNQKTFDIYNGDNKEKDHLNDRNGTDKDAKNLEDTFRNLGFEYVQTFKDKTKSQIEKKIKALSQADHSNYDYFGCAVLTHGGKGGVLYARDAEMNIDDFTKPFRADLCPTLAGKPKLFFIQGCQGTKLQDGYKILDPCHVVSDGLDGEFNSEDAVDGVEEEKEIIIPSEADFLIANSTVEGYYAWRNMTNGAWFIQSLCNVFDNKGKEWEIMQLMTRVNATMAFEFETESPNEKYSKKKQIPSIATRLTAEVYFPPKKKVEENQVNNHPFQTSTVATSDQSEGYSGNQIVSQESESSTSFDGPSNYNYQDCQGSHGDDPTPSISKKQIAQTSKTGNVFRYIPEQWMATKQSDGSVLLEQICNL